MAEVGSGYIDEAKCSTVELESWPTPRSPFSTSSRLPPRLYAVLAKTPCSTAASEISFFFRFMSALGSVAYCRVFIVLPLMLGRCRFSFAVRSNGNSVVRSRLFKAQ